MSHQNPSWKAYTDGIFSVGYNTERWIFIVCLWLLLWCTEAMSIFPPCSIKMELCGLWRDLPAHATTDPVQTLHSKVLSDPLLAHTPKHIFRMCHEPSETSLLISPSPKHTGTHILKDVPPNKSRLIKTDSWLTAVCLCLAVSNQRLPPLVLMCKLQSSQMGSCY